MKRYALTILAAAALLAVPNTAATGEAGPKAADPDITARPYLCKLGVQGKVLSAKPLNGGASTLTYTFGPKACGRRVDSFRFIAFEAEFTYTTSGNVVLTFTEGQRGATPDKTPQVCAGAGTCVQIDAGVFSKAVTTNKKFSNRLGIRGYPVWRVVASHDNTPAAGDILTLWLYLTD